MVIIQFPGLRIMVCNRNQIRRMQTKSSFACFCAEVLVLLLLQSLLNNSKRAQASQFLLRPSTSGPLFRDWSARNSGMGGVDNEPQINPYDSCANSVEERGGGGLPPNPITSGKSKKHSFRKGSRRRNLLSEKQQKPKP